MWMTSIAWFPCDDGAVNSPVWTKQHCMLCPVAVLAVRRSGTVHGTGECTASRSVDTACIQTGLVDGMTGAVPGSRAARSLYATHPALGMSIPVSHIMAPGINLSPYRHHNAGRDGTMKRVSVQTRVMHGYGTRDGYGTRSREPERTCCVSYKHTTLELVYKQRMRQNGDTNY